MSEQTLEEKINAEKYLFQEVKMFTKRLQEFNDTNFFKEKNLSENDIKETSDFINDLINLIEKYHQKDDNKLLKPVIEVCIDLLESFLIGPKCTGFLSILSSRYLLLISDIINKESKQKEE